MRKPASPDASDREEDIRWKQAFFGEPANAMVFHMPHPLVAIYVRVSSQDQAEGLSLQAQERRLKETAERKGWDVREVYHEIVSAEALIKRPQMLRALKDAEAKRFQVFMVVFQNRLARNTMDALLIAKQFTDSGVSIWVDDRNRFVDISNKTGLLEFTMMAGIDTYERMDIKDRMALGREQARISGRGRIGGSAPYGWKLQAITPLPKKGPRYRLIVDQKEAKVVRESFYGKPDWSDRRLTAFLNEKGIPSKTGKKWEPREVRRIRTRRLYCGEYVYKGEVHEALDVPAIISKDAWLIMQGSLRRGAFAPASKTKHPLAGIAFCGHCGSRYYVKWHPNPGNRKAYGAYFCSSRTRKHLACPESRSYSPWFVHEKLIKNIRKRLSRPGFLEEGYKRYLATDSGTEPQYELLSLEARIRELGEEKQRIVEAISKGVITHADATRKMFELTRMQNRLQFHMEAAVKKTQKIPPLEDFKKWTRKIDEADSETLRLLIQALVEKVVFYRDSMSIYYRFWPRAIVKVALRRTERG
jgi:site-specific DNA recombinase